MAGVKIITNTASQEGAELLVALAGQNKGLELVAWHKQFIQVRAPGKLVVRRDVFEAGSPLRWEVLAECYVTEGVGCLEPDKLTIKSAK